MHLKEFAKNVCFGGTWQKWWFFGTVPVGLLVTSTLAAKIIPQANVNRVLVYALAFNASVFVLGVMASIVVAYDRACAVRDELKQRLQGIVLGEVTARAGEHVQPQDLDDWSAHHTILVELDVTVRNRDTQGITTLELTSCAVNVQSAEPFYLGFRDSLRDGDAGMYVDSAAGETRVLPVLAKFMLPVTATHINATEVEGVISFRDTRENAYEKRFSATLVKNPVRRQSSSSDSIIFVSPYGKDGWMQ